MSRITTKKRLSVLALALMILSLLFGTYTAQATSADVPAMPFEEKLSISFLWDMSPKYAGLITSYDELPYYRWLEERLNVDFVFEHVSQDVYNEQAGLIIASGNYPDYMLFNDSMYKGGVNSAFADGIILSLNQFMEDGYMPNLTMFMETYPNYARDVKNDDGYYLNFPFIRANEGYLVFSGTALRADLLDAYGLTVPETVDEWEHVLTVFKDNGVKVPFTMQGLTLIKTTNAFTGAYGVGIDMFQEDGKIIYGASDPRFKGFLELMQRWYAEGLLDPDFVSIDANTVRAKAAEGLAGSFLGIGGGTFQSGWNSVIEQDPESEFRLVGAPYPVLNKGDVAPLGHRTAAYSGGGCGFITSKCKNPELVALVMDFCYSEEANRAMFYGLEGENYTFDEQGRVQTWKLDDAGNLIQLGESWKPNRLEVPGPYIQGIMDYSEGIIYHNQDPLLYVPVPMPTDPVELAKRHVSIALDDAYKAWTAPRPGLLPTVFQTAEDSARSAQLMTPINTFRDESIIQFILGQKPLSEFDSYVAQIEKMGIAEAVAILQKYLDQYNSR